MQRTRVQFETAPGACLGCLSWHLTKLMPFWQDLASKIESAVKPKEGETLLWKLFYNLSPDDDFEEREKSPEPSLHGTVSLVNQYGWIEGFFPHNFSFCIIGFSVYSSEKGRMFYHTPEGYYPSDEEIPEFVAKALRK